MAEQLAAGEVQTTNRLRTAAAAAAAVAGPVGETEVAAVEAEPEGRDGERSVV